MAVTFNAASSAGQVTNTFYTQSLCRDRFANRVITVGCNSGDTANARAIKTYPYNPPHTLLSEVAYAAPLTAGVGNEKIWPLKLSNHALIQGYMSGFTSGSGSPRTPIIKVDKATGIPAAIFGTGSTSNNYSSSGFVYVQSGGASLSYDAAGLEYALFASGSIYGHVGVIETAGMTYKGHQNDLSNTGVGCHIQSCGTSAQAITGFPRWYVVVGDPNAGVSGVTELSLVVCNTTSNTLSITILFSKTDAQMLADYGAEPGHDTVAPIDITGQNTLLLYVSGTGSNDFLVAISKVDHLTRLWTNTLRATRSNDESNFHDYDVVNNRIAQAESGTGNHGAELINTITGVDADSAAGPAGTGAGFDTGWWDGTTGRGFIANGSAAIPFYSYSFDTYSPNPDQPAPLPAPPPDYALILRGSRLTSVVNNFGNYMVNQLQLYSDKGGGIDVAQDVDMNGQKITGLAQAGAGGDLVTKAQLEATIV